MKKINAHLLDYDPALAAEWHPTKNRPLTPDQVAPKSGKKVWWICKNNHEWPAVIASRSTNKRGCPYCAGQKVLPETSLAAVAPDIAKEWDYKKNSPTNPIDVFPNSHHKYWWICNSGHPSYSSSVANRNNGRKCPECSSKKHGERRRAAAINNQGSIVDTHPHLIQEWHNEKNEGLTPNSFPPASNKKVWWKCARGHEWDTTIAHRTNGTECPKCNPQTSRLEIRIFSEIKAMFSDAVWRDKSLGVECDVFVPSVNLAIEVDGYPWHKNRTEEDTSKQQLLASNNIKLIRLRDHRLDKLMPTDLVYTHSNKHKDILIELWKQVSKLAGLSHKQKESIDRAIKKNSFLNSVEYRRLLSLLPGPLEEESLTRKFKSIANEWHPEKNAPLLPAHVSYASNLKVWWKCSKGHEWTATVNNRTSNKRNCPECKKTNAAQNATLQGLKRSGSLQKKRPDLAKQWHPTLNEGLTPNDVSPGSGRRVWWVCTGEHIWDATVNNRNNGTGCPECNKKNRYGSR